MKQKFLIGFISLAAVLAGAYLLYQYYFPNVVARAITTEQLPAYLPAPVKRAIAAARVPVNRGAEDVVKEMHKADIPLDKILYLIDNTSEKQINSILEELTNTQLQSTNQVFDIFIQHLSADFDLEVLRKPFNDNTNLKMIHKAMAYARWNLSAKNPDIGILRTIAKKVIVKKEKELQHHNIAN
jgi:hypothetical protein